MEEFHRESMIKVEEYAHQVDMSPPKMSTNMKGMSIMEKLLRNLTGTSSVACAKVRHLVFWWCSVRCATC